MVSHSNFKSLCWSSVSESIYSLKENGIEFNACWLGLPPELGVPLTVGLSPEPGAVNFGFLEVDPVLWPGPDPSISKSVLWRFPVAVLGEGFAFGFAFSSWPSETPTVFSSLAVTGA
jgi:hypothetical protein